jgi:hypothetical protein
VKIKYSLYTLGVYGHLGNIFQIEFSRVLFFSNKNSIKDLKTFKAEICFGFENALKPKVFGNQYFGKYF